MKSVQSNQNRQERSSTAVKIIVLFCVFLIMMCFSGANSTSGVFLPVVAEATGWTPVQISFAVTFSSVGGLVSGFLFGPVLARVGICTVYFVYILCGSLGFIVRSIAPSLLPFYLGSLLTGFGTGFGSIGSVVVNQRFTKHRAEAMGFLLGSFGFGSAVLSMFAAPLLQRVRWQSAYLILGILLLVITLICAAPILYTDPEQSESHKKDGIRQKTNAARQQNILKMPVFYAFMLGLCLVPLFYYSFTVYSSSYFIANGLSSVEAASYFSLYSLAATSATVLSGFLIGRKGVGCYFLCCVVATVIGFTLAMYGSGTASGGTILMIGIILMGTGSSVVATVAVNGTMVLFGPEEYNRFVGLSVALLTLSGGCAGPVYGLLFGAFSQNYRVTFLVLLCVSMAGLLWIVFFTKWYHRTRKRMETK